MNSFENIIKEIYCQIKVVRDNGKEPYYLLLSEEIYVAMKVEICRENNLFPMERGFDFFDSLEVVHIPNIEINYIEVKGITPPYAF